MAQVGNFPGAPSVLSSRAVYGNEPFVQMREDSEGIQLGRMQQQGRDRDRDFQVQNETANRLSGDANRAADRGVQLELGMAPINFKREVFGQISPLLSGLLTGSTERVGGQSGAAPSITRGPVWTGDQIQQQVNAGQAANQATADTANRATATRLAGQGFGARSPLAAALQSSTAMQTAAANADVDRQTRWDAAQGNADSVYRGDQLATQQWQLAEDQDIRRRQMQTTYAGNLASVLAGLV